MTGTDRHSSRRIVVLVTGIALVVAAVSIVLASTGSAERTGGRSAGPHIAGPARASAPGVVPPLGRASEPGVGDTGPARAHASASRPSRLTIKAIGVDTTLERLHLLGDGSLEAPSAWGRAGWYAGGVVPGQIGPAVIVGHIDSTSGPAVFFRLGALHRGDPVHVTLRDGTVLTFVVDDLRRFAKKDFPTETVYGPTPDPQLRLITCTGAFDAGAHSYVDNLVVSLHLV